MKMNDCTSSTSSSTADSTMMSTPTTTDTTSHYIETGERLAEALNKLLKGIQQKLLKVDVKDVHRLNRCFARGNPEPEYEGPVLDSRMFQDLHSFMESLETDPEGRAHVVDHDSTEFTEDSLWVSLPKWQALLGLHDIQFNVTTIRSIERSAFVKSFEGWKIQHASGPRGTAFVRGEASSTSTKALFSDQPRHVCHGGWQQGKLHPNKLIIRVFRCAPRQSLAEGIGAVLQQDCTTNVFDLWIRHHEVPENVAGFGRFQYQVSDAVTLLEMLTAIEIPTPKIEATDSSYSPSTEMPSISAPAVPDAEKEDESSVVISPDKEVVVSHDPTLHSLEQLTQGISTATPEKGEAVLEDAQLEKEFDDDLSEDYLSMQEDEDEYSILSAIEEEDTESADVSLKDCDLSEVARPERHQSDHVEKCMTLEDMEDIAHLVEAAIASNIMKGSPNVVEGGIPQVPELCLTNEMPVLFAEEADKDKAEVVEASTCDASTEGLAKELKEILSSKWASSFEEERENKTKDYLSPTIDPLQAVITSSKTVDYVESVAEYEEDVSEDPLSLLSSETQALFAPDPPSEVATTEGVHSLTTREATAEEDPDSVVKDTANSLKVLVPTSNRLSGMDDEINNAKPVLLSNLAALFGMPSKVCSDTTYEKECVDYSNADKTQDLVAEEVENQPSENLSAGDKPIVGEKDEDAQKKKTVMPFSERPVNVPLIRCSDCRTNKAKHNFSKSQLRKPRTRCKDCVGST